MDLNSELGQLIDALSAARASGNPMLMEVAGNWINQFMAKVEITERQEDGGEG